MSNLPVNQALLLALLSVIWFNPEIVSNWALVSVLALVGGFLLAQLFIIAIEYVLICYGANRQGVAFLSIILGLLGIAIGYFAWIEASYSMFNISWIIVYTSFGVFTAAHKRQLGTVLRDMFLYIEYLFIALFSAALFQTYISQSSLASYELQYSGVAGETLWFIAMVVLVCDIAYKTYLELARSTKQIVGKMTKK